MITKFAILLFAGACVAFPNENEPLPQNTVAAPLVTPQDIPALPGTPELIPEGELQERPVPPQDPVAGKSENDLKTDNTFWYRRSYYPYIYNRRSYYRPRSYVYSYPSYNPYYTYWNPYSWW